MMQPVPGPTRRRGSATGALRRYPALAFLVAAALLASLLPSALRVPLSGPSASAELAPVPGRSDAAGDVEAFGASSAGGLGSASAFMAPGVDLVGPDPADEPPGSGGNLRNKRCVGNPPRQTEDPLSPACVPYYDGDNGGATAKGVTSNEIRIVLDTCEDRSADLFIDYDDTDDPERDPTVVAYAAHFNARYQLYKRRAHFFEVRWSRCYDDSPQRREQIQRIQERWDPFALITLFKPAGGVGAVDEMARHGIVTLIDSPSRAFLAARAPYAYSVPPDLEDLAVSTAEFICHRLAHRPARFSGEITDQGRMRKFGISYDRPISDPQGRGGALVVDEARRRCQANIENYGTRTRDMPADGVTTVVKMTDDIFDVLFAQGSRWHPEWFIAPGDSVPAHSPLLPPDQWRNAFGFLMARRLGAKPEQAAYVAAEDGCPGCGQFADPYIYDRLLFLLSGIQSAGPRLTPANMQRGLQALPRRSFDPYVPAAYLTPGVNSWLKDAMAVWWDPTGQPPGTDRLGCYRLIESGLRYRAEDWRTKPGDDGIRGMDGTPQPCQGL